MLGASPDGDAPRCSAAHAILIVVLVLILVLVAGFVLVIVLILVLILIVVSVLIHNSFPPKGEYLWNRLYCRFLNHYARNFRFYPAV